MRDLEGDGGGASSGAHGPTDPTLQRALADLCGRLLLREANAADLELLQRPELRAELASLGVRLPGGATETVLEQLAREYQRTFREGGEAPPIASTWRTDQAGETSESAARDAALALGAALDADAPPDHLGNLLRLWARADAADPDVATRLRERHLAWGVDALQERALADDPGFYTGLAGATIALLVQLTGG